MQVYDRAIILQAGSIATAPGREDLSVKIKQLGTVFQPEDLNRLNLAYHAALAEIRGWPEWRRKLGLDETRIIIASTIMAHAQSGFYGNVCLSALAVAAVKAEFLALLEGSSVFRRADLAHANSNLT